MAGRPVFQTTSSPNLASRGYPASNRPRLRPSVILGFSRFPPPPPGARYFFSRFRRIPKITPTPCRHANTFFFSLRANNTTRRGLTGSGRSKPILLTRSFLCIFSLPHLDFPFGFRLAGIEEFRLIDGTDWVCFARAEGSECVGFTSSDIHFGDAPLFLSHYLFLLAFIFFLGCVVLPRGSV
ncbi:hypothetical protein B0J18DRAFT_21488 [Chaetomium sp. MPI-SDFR-AT-0129]|nr:hypothetical protein B0J18DRAFT_21488 [Chaetomium sp. MPI-SDFR-AT-0129]